MSVCYVCLLIFLIKKIIPIPLHKNKKIKTKNAPFFNVKGAKLCLHSF